MSRKTGRFWKRRPIRRSTAAPPGSPSVFGPAGRSQATTAAARPASVLSTASASATLPAQRTCKPRARIASAILATCPAAAPPASGRPASATATRTVLSPMPFPSPVARATPLPVFADPARVIGGRAVKPPHRCAARAVA